MKRTLLIISLFFLGLSSKGQNLTFVDANNLVVNSSNSATWWKPEDGQVWKIEGIHGKSFLNIQSLAYGNIKINSPGTISKPLVYPIWIGSNDSIQGLPHDNSSTMIFNILIFKNEP